MNVKDHLAALTLAGWDDLAPHEQAWVTGRLTWAAAQADLDTLSRTNNPGALRPSAYGSQGGIATLGSLAEGYQLLVGAARRAALRLDTPLPPSIPLRGLDDRQVLRRADSGDLHSRAATNMAMSAAMRDLRQQWEGFDRVGVGQAILPELRQRVVMWRQFRGAWDAGRLGNADSGSWYTPVGDTLQEMVVQANEILHAGVWGDGSPERQKIEEIRARLGAYKAKIETSGVGSATGPRHITLRLAAVEGLERELARLSEPVWHAPGEIGALEIRVGLAVGYWSWFGAPSDAAKQTFGELERDWASFEQEGVPTKFPWLSDTHHAWLTFRAKWNSEEADVTELSSMVADANRVRRDLADALKRPQTKDIQAPDITQVSAPLQTADTILQSAKGAEEAVKDALSDAGKAIGTAWEAIPWQAKAIGGALLGLGVLTTAAPYAQLLVPQRRASAAPREARGAWLPD